MELFIIYPTANTPVPLTKAALSRVQYAADKLAYVYTYILKLI